MKSNWKLIYAFDVEGLPKGQPRPRAMFTGKHVHIYDPGTAEGWKTAVRFACNLNQVKRQDGPLRLAVVFFLPRQKKDKAHEALAPVEKPDIDNLVKGTMDALTRAGAWHDDSQVVELWTQKCYSDGSGTGALIQLFKMEEA